MSNADYPKIETEAQYWIEFNKWDSHLTEIKKEFKKVKNMKNPFMIIEKLTAHINEGVTRQLISQEDGTAMIADLMKRIHKAPPNASQLKVQFKAKANEVINKFKWKKKK